MIPNDWATVSLGSHVSLDVGFSFKSARYTEEREDIRLLRGDNIGQGFLRWDGVKRWPRGDVDGFRNFALRENDVVLAMDRPWIEAGLKYGIVRETDLPCLLVQRVARLRAQSSIDQTFIRYVVGCKDFTDYVKSITTGVNVPHISGRDICAFSFALPPIAMQIRIADILSAYDDLIEVNQRRIAILEEMARRLFDEWFVHFRYLGHESTELIETELGPAPSGWSALPLERQCSRITDGSHWSPASEPTGKPMASVKDMREWGFDTSHCRKISDQDFTTLVRNDCMPRVGDILIAKDGANLNKHTFLITEPLELVILSSIAILRPEEGVNTEFLTAMLKSDEVSARIKRSVSGAAIPRIVLKDFKKLTVLVPPTALQNDWGTRFGPLSQQCRTLSRQNARLRAARDLLLPKLISGEIEVGRAEAAWPEAAE